MGSDSPLIIWRTSVFNLILKNLNMKKVYYLKDEPVTEELEVITWTYKQWGYIIYSTAFVELTNAFYFEN